ncbi:adenylate kinase [Glaciecola sp. 1036]|uniref:adenylate kinase n=1 Tax=Alteromonadaceae TaxID=72275 RepID=UPI003D051737
MQKVAVFGKPGSGKSTLSKALASASDLPLYPLDSIIYKPNGELVAREEFDTIHTDILNSDSWIIDGFGPISAFYQRLDAADTLIYIDLPYWMSYWFVTKRLLKGIIVKPEGWPEGSSAFNGTMQSYKTLKLCPKFWNQDFLDKLLKYSERKEVLIITTLSKLNQFISLQTTKSRK